LVSKVWYQFEWFYFVYAILSLTIVRMLPVAISLIGSRLSKATILFMGWFGPRGLASIVLGLVYLEHRAGHSGEDTIRLAFMATVLLSIFVHGISGMPGINFYTKKIKVLTYNAPENEAI